MYGVDPAKPGAKEYYDSIFELYASWGVDFVKCDDIARELPKEESELIMLSDSLKNCGRDMVLSLSPGPALLEKAELYKQVSNMWRITDDFWDNWQLLYNMFERCEKVGAPQRRRSLGRRRYAPHRIHKAGLLPRHHHPVH